MVDEELDLLESVIEHIKRLKNESEKKVTELDVKLVEKSENKEKKEKIDPILNLVQKVRAGENPLKIEKYASDVVNKEEEQHKRMEEYRDSIMAELHALDWLEKEVVKKKISLTKSFSNEEEITDKEKEMRLARRRK